MCIKAAERDSDKEFPPNATSLGNIGGDTANKESGKSDATTKWVRANNFNNKKLTKDGKAKMQLFGETVDARDICQGALGNCWLLAAMACIAEHKGAIHSVFKSKERNPKGKYRLRLYDGSNSQWKHLTIDDYIPVDKNRYEKDGTCSPVFSQPNGNELYAMLLEKAFAKFCGSYEKLEGGQTIWAIRAMTGDPARWFYKDKDGTKWARWDMVDLKDDTNMRATKLVAHGEAINNDTMFQVLLKYNKMKSILCASGASGKDGLHTGHAYSILDVAEVNTGLLGTGTTFRLVKIRNPWGSGEWTGDWGDKSEMWNKEPKVKKALGYEPTDDGAFWMSWDDYVANWDRIGVVHRTIDISSLGLTLKDDSSTAPVEACAAGCCRFWCCCEGCRRLYFPYRSSEDTIKVGGCMGFCQKSAAVEPV